MAPHYDRVIVVAERLLFADGRTSTCRCVPSTCWAGIFRLRMRISGKPEVRLGWTCGHGENGRHGGNRRGTELRRRGFVAVAEGGVDASVVDVGGAVDAAGVDAEEDGDALAGAAGDFGGRDGLPRVFRTLSYCFYAASWVVM